MASDSKAVQMPLEAQGQNGAQEKRERRQGSICCGQDSRASIREEREWGGGVLGEQVLLDAWGWAGA